MPRPYAARSARSDRRRHGVPDAPDLVRLHVRALVLRSGFVAVLTVVALLVPVGGERRLDIVAGLAVAFAYNSALLLATRRSGSVPAVLAVGDQALCVAFVLLWPQLLAPAVIAGLLDVGIAAVLLDRRAAMRGAAVGGLLLTAVTLGPQAEGLLLAEHVFVAPAYMIAALTSAFVVGSVAGRERDSQRHLRGLLTALQVVVYELDLQANQVRYVSPHVVALTGRPASDWLGDPRRMLASVHPADRRPLVEAVTAAIAGEDVPPLEYRIVTAADELRWVRNVGTVTVDESGRPVLRGSIADVTAQKEAECALARQASTDDLTGLENRAGLLQAMASKAADGEHADALRLLAFLDLDSFKRVNDSLGHTAGDALLVEVADRLQGAVRRDDDVARIGGDEFVVLVRLDSADDAEQVVRRLLAVFDAPFELAGRPLSVTASAGAVVVAPETVAGSGPEPLLQCADAAMYTAKRTGPGRFAFFTESMRAAALRRLDLETELRTALDERQFSLAYQPIVRASDGVLVGHEALVRWQHPERGTVPPGEFIAVAEETGQVVELGRWILQEACSQARRWGATTTMSVNLSARQLGDASLVADVAMALHEAGLPASALTLEITETALVSEPEQALTTLRALRALGITIALDDFGTGFSSLSHLHHYPVDIVKIDRSFVDGVADPHSDGRGIVSAVIGLAAHMRLTVVAEGVETEDQALALRDMGADRLQGYYFGKPEPARTGQVPAQVPVPLPRTEDAALHLVV